MKHIASRIAGAVAGAFGRRIKPRQDFPLEMFGQYTQAWVGLLREAMQRSGKGYRQYTLKRGSFEAFAAERTGPFKWGDARAAWQAQRRPDKVAQAERDAKNPCFYGKLNYRRSEAPS